jgi:hypothetical protein
MKTTPERPYGEEEKEKRASFEQLYRDLLLLQEGSKDFRFLGSIKTLDKI